MNTDDVLADYESAFADVAETVQVRIYTGSGAGRTFTDHAVRARVMNFVAEQLVGPIVQGDRKLIVSAADVAAAGVTLTNGANCKIVVRGRELQVKAVDDNTRRLAGTLMAYEVVVG